MMLATPAEFRASFGAEEVANLTRLYMEALPPVDYLPGEAPQGKTEDEVISWALSRATGLAASYLLARYPAIGCESLPAGMVIPSALVNAVCDIARYYLTGTPVQETDPITERYKIALSWLKDVASGLANLPGLDDAGGGGDDDEAGPIGSVAFASDDRIWSFGS